jgi:glycine cleavage system aminomethyltransferase T/glycine/D-amino acid oxidase-like deaminating enzyme
MDLLADRSLSAATFQNEESGSLPRRASVIVVGGGIIGSSIAYHLAQAGVHDVLLVERNVLTSGTTWHAAGLIANARGSIALTGLSQYGPELYSSLHAETGIDVGLTTPGSISVARTAARVDELTHAADVAHHCGVRAELLSPEGIAKLWPLASMDGILAGLFFPDDGYVNPGYASIALAQLASRSGVVIRENVHVVELVTDRGAVRGIRTPSGTIEADVVVLASGLWSRDLAATAGVHLPLYAAEHVHVRTEPIPASLEGLPVLRDVDNSYYLRREGNRLLLGAFEPQGIPRSTDEIDSSGFATFSPNWEHFGPIRQTAEKTVPALVTAGYERFINAPESFTPDNNFLLGETAEVSGLFVAAGMNSQGIIYGPGVGRAAAAWITSGSPDFDSASVDVQRFSRHQSNRRYLHRRTRESLGRLYATHWPHYQAHTARDVRRSPLHFSLASRDARFGEINALERANWFGGPSVEDSYSFGRPGWFDQVRNEHTSARESVALFDLSAFATFEVIGVDAMELCQIATTANIDQPVGRVVYTLFCNAAGGIELDGTVTRISSTRFMVVTPSTSHTKALGYLTRLSRDFSAQVTDLTSSLATIGVMGPNSRELLSRISPADWSNDAHPLFSGREVEVADGFGWVMRLSYVGELGYEIYVPSDLAVNVYEALWEAGADLGVKPAGFYALDSLRLEKGYRHLGHDIGAAVDPYTAGLGFAVDGSEDSDFMGRAALKKIDRAALKNRAIYLTVDDPEVILTHDETIFAGAHQVGQVTSSAYGHTLGRTVGLGLIERNVNLDENFRLRSMGREHSITVSARPFYDPDNHRMIG